MVLWQSALAVGGLADDGVTVGGESVGEVTLAVGGVAIGEVAVGGEPYGEVVVVGVVLAPGAVGVPYVVAILCQSPVLKQ